jgi:GNAT superfamily N-acetyltransferase
MPVRPFHRADRDQVTRLVNAHIGAVVPGISVSVQGLLSQLERNPGEYVVDPWVTDRRTLVAEERGRIVAAAHLLRYGADETVGEHYRDTGEIDWLLCWPDATAAGAELAAGCLAQLAAWRVGRAYAGGGLSAPGVYGVPAQWPHIRDLLRQAGFTAGARTETVYLARVADLPCPEPVPGRVAVRTVGVNGTRLTAVAGGTVLGYIEVDTNLETANRMSRTGDWADVGNLHVEPEHRRRGVGTWLLGQAAEWLALAGVTRLLDYAAASDGGADGGYEAFLAARGFRELTTTVRGLTTEQITTAAR